MIGIVKHAKWFGTISIALFIAGIVALLMYRLPLSIEFTGGSLTTLQFVEPIPTTEEVVQALSGSLFAESQVQKLGPNDMQIRGRDYATDEHTSFIALLQEKFPGVIELSFESIGPSLGRELQTKAFLAIGLVLLGIILYLTYVFRKVSRPVPSWVYGLMAIIALLHDIGITIGFYALFAHFSGATADSLFITALLTILGFSVHDTIVVFDRIRENLTRFAGAASFADIVTVSTNQTMARSLNTSLTTILVLTCLSIFGGKTIFPFALTLVVGIMLGTYSSIFIASPLLVWWQRLAQRRKRL